MGKCFFKRCEILIRNSLQGDKGYCYIPYDYMTNSKYCFDPWAVRKLETNDMGHEYWNEDDSVDYYDDDDGDGESGDDGEIEDEEADSGDDDE